MIVKKKNEPCRMFSTTGTSISLKLYAFIFTTKQQRGGAWFSANISFHLGSCIKGPQCRFVHDPSKTAICKSFLKGSCPSGESCDLSHDSTPERSPACLHFLRGNCSNANCLYTHVRASPTAPVCRAFGVYGYCEKGAQCKDRHVFECPDFSNTGKCATKGCKLLHREKASVLRKNANRGEASADDNSSDLSSDDDDEEIDSDDVDSDDLDEEFLGDDHEPDVDAMQQDYVQLS